MSKYKVITSDNFLLSDFAAQWAVVDGQPRPMVMEDFLEIVAPLKLTDRTPEEVAEMFEVAKGAFVYGFLYRPLQTMGYHYAILAVEAALYATYKQAGGNDQKATMHNTLEYLESRKLVPAYPSPVPRFPTAYHLAKEMRDKIFAHPQFTAMIGLGGFNIFELCAGLINALYP